MSTEIFDFHWITQEIACGGYIVKESFPDLAKKEDISHVVDLRAEACDDSLLFKKLGVNFLHLPTVDLMGSTVEQLSSGVEWVRSALEKRERVLIHCQHGIGRSALLTCCVLVSVGLTPIEALRLTKQKRPKVSPSPEQLNRYLEWIQHWYQRNEMNSQMEVTWEALAEIAYVHLRG